MRHIAQRVAPIPQPPTQTNRTYAVASRNPFTDPGAQRPRHTVLPSEARISAKEAAHEVLHGLRCGAVEDGDGTRQPA